MKLIDEKSRMPFTRSIVFACFLITVTAGCSNFEHSLPWAQSAFHKELQGSWQSVEGAEDPFKMDVVLNEDGSLSVDISVDVSVESSSPNSSLPFAEKTRKVFFKGDVLTSNEVDVLQIDMSSYKESDAENEETRDTSQDGFRFVNVVSVGDLMVFRQLDIEQFAQYAEEELVREGTTLTTSEFADCIDDSIRENVFLVILKEFLKERPSSLLSEEEIVELEQELKAFEIKEVEPYKELQEMRECVAYKLPGDELGKLFSSDADASFSGESIQMMKVE